MQPRLQRWDTSWLRGSRFPRTTAPWSGVRKSASLHQLLSLTNCPPACKLTCLLPSSSSTSSSGSCSSNSDCHALWAWLEFLRRPGLAARLPSPKGAAQEAELLPRRARLVRLHAPPNVWWQGCSRQRRAHRCWPRVQISCVDVSFFTAITAVSGSRCVTSGCCPN